MNQLFADCSIIGLFLVKCFVEKFLFNRKNSGRDFYRRVARFGGE